MKRWSCAILSTALLAAACSDTERGAGTGGGGGGGGGVVGGTGGSSGGATDAGAAESIAPGVRGPSFPAVADFADRGPFETARDTGGPQCTTFRPDPLGPNGLRHPVIVWGNGTYSSPTIYAAVLTHWASHGFIAVAADTSNAGTGQEMKACLDYILAEGEKAGSAYQGKVDAARVGSAGHSQGGGGAIMLGTDPRVTATAPLQPYVMGLGHQMSSQSMQRGPMFLMSGSADTIAAPTENQQPVFENANVPVFWGTLAGANHVTSAIGNISGFRGPATAWFRLHLMNDATARPLFYGADCALCSDATWAVKRKNIN